MHPLVVAIETSGAAGSVCLLEPGQPPREQALELRGQHGQSLIPALHALLRERGRRLDPTCLIAVSTGPGSYTGLRVGVVCAKTLAYATGAELVGVETLLAIAENAPSDVASLQVVANAQRGALYVGRYVRCADSTWRAAMPVEIVPALEWAQRLRGSDVLAGPGLATLRRLRPDAVDGPSCRVLPEDLWQPRGQTVARLGLAAFMAGQRDSCWTLQPRYLQRSSAEVQWDQLHPVQSAVPAGK